MADGNAVTSSLLAAMAYSREPMSLSDPTLPDHPIIAVNAAFVTLSGYAEQQVVGRNCRFLQAEGTDAATRGRIRRCIAQRRGCIEWILNRRRDGTEFWNLLFLSPVFDGEGNLLHYFGNQRDITAGPPADMPAFRLGMADMRPAAQHAFDALIREMAEAAPGWPEAGGLAASLERAIDTARRLNAVTLDLAPAGG
jgi:PAS domain S-box-containing protein